jgi:hypothetical protein
MTASKPRRVVQQAISRLSDLAHEIPRTELRLQKSSNGRGLLRFQAEAEKERGQTATDLES